MNEYIGSQYIFMYHDYLEERMNGTSFVSAYVLQLSRGLLRCYKLQGYM